MRHGTYTGYNYYGCRCDACGTAHFRYMKQIRLPGHKSRLVDATGTKRRIRALAAIGWTFAQIGTHAGYTTKGGIKELTHRDRVNRAQAERVREVYDKLSMTPGPSPHARDRARHAGWPPPLAWDDSTIDDPAAEPDMGAPDDGRVTVPVDDIEHLIYYGGCDRWGTLTRRLDTTREAVRVKLRRHRRYDLLRLLDGAENRKAS